MRFGRPPGDAPEAEAQGLFAVAVGVVAEGTPHGLGMAVFPVVEVVELLLVVDVLVLLLPHGLGMAAPVAHCPELAGLDEAVDDDDDEDEA